MVQRRPGPTGNGQQVVITTMRCVKEGHARSDADIREYMSGNLCRCGAYPRIFEAAMAAAKEEKGG